MSYLTQSAISMNYAMQSRVAQCAAQQGIQDPDTWSGVNRREWASAPGWDAAWESALASHPPDPETGEQQYDPGMDEAVITDQMILSQVQAMSA